jgi:hypothetical protein
LDNAAKTKVSREISLIDKVASTGSATGFEPLPEPVEGNLAYRSHRRHESQYSRY